MTPNRSGPSLAMLGITLFNILFGFAGCVAALGMRLNHSTSSFLTAILIGGFEAEVIIEARLFLKYIRLRSGRAKPQGTGGHLIESAGLFPSPPTFIGRVQPYVPEKWLRYEIRGLLIAGMVSVVPTVNGFVGPVRPLPPFFLLLVSAWLGCVAFIPLCGLVGLDRGAGPGTAILGRTTKYVVVLAYAEMSAVFLWNLPTWGWIVGNPSAALLAAGGTLCAFAAAGASLMCTFRVKWDQPILPGQIPVYRRVCHWIIWTGGISFYLDGLSFLAQIPPHYRMGGIQAEVEIFLLIITVCSVQVISVQLISAMEPLPRALAASPPSGDAVV